MVFLYKSSSDLMDKIIQNRHGEKGVGGDRRGVKSFLLIWPTSGFLYFIAGWNYSKLIYIHTSPHNSATTSHLQKENSTYAKQMRGMILADY